MRRLLSALLLPLFLAGNLPAEETEEKVGLSEFTKYLRAYANMENISPEKARDLAAKDPNLAKSPYAKDLVILILNDLMFLHSASRSSGSPRIDFPNANPYRTPSLPRLDSRGQLGAPITGAQYGNSGSSSNKEARTKNIESRLALLEKHFLTPQGQAFALSMRGAFLCAIAPEVAARFEKRRAGQVFNLALEVASVGSRGIRAYELTWNRGETADKTHTVLVSGYKAPVKEGDIIRINADKYEAGGNGRPLLVEFVVREDLKAPDIRRPEALPHRGPFRGTVGLHIFNALLMSFSGRALASIPDAKEHLPEAIVAAATDPTLASFTAIRENTLKILRETQILVAAREKFEAAYKNATPPEAVSEEMRLQSENSRKIIGAAQSELFSLFAKSDGASFRFPSDSRFLQIIMGQTSPFLRPAE